MKNKYNIYLSSLYKKVKKRAALTIVVSAFAVVGTVLLLASHAATPNEYASINAGQGTLSSNACKFADSTADDGLAVEFGTSCNVNTDLLSEQKQLVQLGLNQIMCVDQPNGSTCSNNYSNGELVPSEYDANSWSVYGAAVGGIATLGVQPDGTSAERTMAIDILNTGIATHQQPSGYFDAGTAASGDGGVDAGMWVEAEGYSALLLRNSVSSEQLDQWEKSMAAYAGYLKTNKNLTFYPNGNVVIRQSVILLETYKLAELVGDPNAATYLSEYQAEKQFLVNPSASFPGENPPYWDDYGEHITSNGGFYYTESEASEYTEPLLCASGMSPCNGFDPEYSMLQMDDTAVAIAVSGMATGVASDTLNNQAEVHYWLNSINGEYKAELPLIGLPQTVSTCPSVTTGIIDAANGSRKNHPCDAFDPPLFYDLEANGQGNYDNLWSIQLALYKPNITTGIIQNLPSENAYRYLLFLSAALNTNIIP
jgi:hypothetical protein